MVSPHFPPDSSAGAHRVRLLAPHLTSFGWKPTVITVDPHDYEGRLDYELLGLVPPDLNIARCRAWPAAATRRFGIGDLGLRAFMGLLSTCSRYFSTRRIDVLFITTYPVYPAMLGPFFKRRYGIPFVLDYQDPWIGAWGRAVGGGANGRPDLKSRLSRAVATLLEPIVVRSADAITAVSCGTYEQVRARYPDIRHIPCVELPLGLEGRDFDRLQTAPRSNRFFDRADGNMHVCYVGTVLPLGMSTLEAMLGAVTLVRTRRPELYKRLRLHFFGTSNQTSTHAAPRVLPIAQARGLSDVVSEVAPRINYLDALTVQTEATALLLMGSSEPHYTASKVYPALLARRPILAIYHKSSTVVEILRQVASAPAARVVTYDEAELPSSKVEEIASQLVATLETAPRGPIDVDAQSLNQFSARSLAGRLARLFERISVP